MATDDHSTPVAGVEVDAEVSRLLTMQQQVQCDVYHMKAYVRFRKVVDGSVEHYIAWHQPDHPILPLAAPFFLRNGLLLCAGRSSRRRRRPIGMGRPSASARE
ncbi:MAG: DUF4130 domain-containing protein [Nitrospira sp.]|nr:DUF4130 domain-containing protein [Nitrospira sp.]